MNPNEPDTAGIPAPEAGADPEATPKPRRRRTAKVADAAADVSATLAPAAAAPDAPAPEQTADAGPAPARKRTRRKPVDAPVDAVAAEPVAPSAPTPAVEPPLAGSDAAGDAAPASGASAEEAVAGESGPAAEGRRRRRNRRRGRRGADRAGVPEAGAVDDAAGDESPDTEDAVAAAEPVPSLPPTDVNELFAEVLSGAYDSGAAEEAAVGLAEPPKRVLAADPDAPKLHKVLAQAGAGSRRDLEQMIVEGRVAVNGQPAHVGQRISFGDRISIDGKPVRVRIAPPPPRVIAYHKPVGEVVTHDDPQQRPTVFRRLPRLPQGKWQSVGRLDINTEGLLLFTNSGDLANRLMHPRFGVEREYAVRVLGTLTDDERATLLEGVEIEGQAAAFRSIVDGGGEGVNHWYRVVITEGRNREVRKLFDAVGKAVSRLIRIRYGSVVLPRGLRRGVWVDLSNDDVKALRNATGMALHREGEGAGPDDKRGRRGGRRGRGGRREGDERQPQGAPRDAAPDYDADDDIDDIGPIPNPLQQTYDKRAIQQARRPQREYGDDGPIPNPLQQTYDKRALQGDRKPKREYGDEGPIPNPLQQTYDKRFAQGGGPKSGGGGGGAGGGGRGRRKGGGGQRAGGAGGGQPDPMRTAVGYIGADAFHNKGRGGRGKGGGRGGKGGGKGGGRR